MTKGKQDTMCGCDKKSCTCMFIFFSVLVFLCGAVLVGLGIWARVEDDGCSHRALAEKADAAVILVIVSGVAICLVTFAGCFASFNKSKCGIVSYSVLALIIITLQVIGCIIFFVMYRARTEELMNDFQQLCLDQDTPLQIQGSEAFFRTFYYLMTGTTIVSIVLELVVLMIIVCQYQRIP